MLSLHPDSDFFICIINTQENNFSSFSKITTLHASSFILCAKCKYFEDIKKSKNIIHKTLTIDSPYTFELINLLTWLHNNDTKELIQKTNSLQSLFQTCAMSKILGVKKFTNIYHILQSIHLMVSQFNESVNISECLCKEYINIHFLLIILRNTKIINYEKAVKICIILE